MVRIDATKLVAALKHVIESAKEGRPYGWAGLSFRLEDDSTISGTNPLTSYSIREVEWFVEKRVPHDATVFVSFFADEAKESHVAEFVLTFGKGCNTSEDRSGRIGAEGLIRTDVLPSCERARLAISATSALH